MFENNTRRSFIKAATLGGIVLAVPEVVSASIENIAKGRIAISKDDVILFQGDSITDAGRNRDDLNSNSVAALGSGYAFLAASELLYRHSDKNVKIVNRGVSGDKVPDLETRWERDCLALKPNILSIHIGVNDHWHTKMRGYKGTVQSYESGYRKLLNAALNMNPDLKLIIGEPFGVAGLKGHYEKWDPVFKEFQQVAANIAASYKAPLVPYQQAFDKAQQMAPAQYWTWDGVHPTLAGSKLMAETWLSVINHR